MYKPKFKQRSLKETLTLLCKARGGEYLRAGKVNQSHLARLAGTSQANIFRWMNDEAKANDEHVRKLAKAFGIAPAQMRGEEPINELDGIKPATKEDSIFYNEYQDLPEWMKRSIREQIRIYKVEQEADEK